MDDETVMESTVAYVFIRKRRDQIDIPEFVVADDADELGEALDYLSDLSDSDSSLVTGDIHAADPGSKYHVVGDWYLLKCHGLDVSHTFAESILPDDADSGI